jgi:hypothetical protein
MVTFFPSYFCADALPKTAAIKEWSSIDVVNFLWSLKLGEALARIFYEADVNGADLLVMDDEKLKDLGVVAVGHRKRILSDLVRRQAGSQTTTVRSGTTTPKSHLNVSGASTPKRSSSSSSLKAQAVSETNSNESVTASSSTSSSETEQDLKVHRRNARKGSIVSLDSADDSKSRQSALKVRKASSDRNLSAKLKPSRSAKNITVSDTTGDVPSEERNNIKFACKVIDSDHSVVVRVSANGLQLRDLREDIMDVLLAHKVVKSYKAFEVYESATGVLELMEEQSQLDTLLSQAKSQKISSITLYIAFGSEMSSSKCWDSAMTVIDAKQTMEASSFCCTLVEPESTRMFQSPACLDFTQEMLMWPDLFSSLRRHCCHE